MSVQIDTAFSQQFSANVQLLSQQTGSILRGGVSEEAVTGEGFLRPGWSCSRCEAHL